MHICVNICVYTYICVLIYARPWGTVPIRSYRDSPSRTRKREEDTCRKRTPVCSLDSHDSWAVARSRNSRHNACGVVQDTWMRVNKLACITGIRLDEGEQTKRNEMFLIKKDDFLRQPIGLRHPTVDSSQSHTHTHTHTHTPHSYIYTHTYNQTHAPATHYNTLQHTTTHCNTLQHTATHCNSQQTCDVRCSSKYR